MWKHANEMYIRWQEEFYIQCKTAVDEALAFREIKHESYYNTSME